MSRCVIGSAIFSPGLANPEGPIGAQAKCAVHSWRQTNMPDLGEDFAAGTMNFLDHTFPSSQGFLTVEVWHIGIETRCRMWNVGALP